MEFNLIVNGPLKYREGILTTDPMAALDPTTVMAHSCIHERTKKDILSSSHLTFNPVIYEDGVPRDAFLDSKSSREITIDLLFGDSNMAKQLKMGSVIPVTTHFTVTCSNTGRLMIETKLVDAAGVEIDVFEELDKLQRNLPPNSIEFIVNVNGFRNETYPAYKLDFVERGLKLVQNEWGSARLEMTNINFPDNNWYSNWSNWHEEFVGYLSLNVRVDTAAAAELYKKYFGGGPLGSQVATAADMVILVSDNEDMDQDFVSVIKCHKSVLSEMSLVFATMFQAEISEPNERTLEIADFSEACIQALIGFAYRGDVGDTLKSSAMALELLQLAHKYQIKKLVDILVHMIWCMPCSWFDVDVAVKLVCYVKNAAEDFCQVEKKGWLVLQWYAKDDPEKFMQSKQSVCFNQNPGAVKEVEFGMKVLSLIN